METHGGNNQSGPQRQVPSFFKDGSVTAGNGTPETSAAPAPVSSGNMSAKSSTPGLSNRLPRNPYQLEPLSREKASPENLDIDPFEKSPGSSLWKRIKDKLLPETEGVSNTKQKVMVVLIPILFIVMIFMFRQVLSKAPQETQGAPDDDTPLVGLKTSEDEIDWKIPQPMPVRMRDPIKLAAQSTPDNNEQSGTSNGPGTEMFGVRGILYSDDKPSAVIGNKIVHLNETIDGIKIVKIDKDYVVFEKDGKSWTKKVAELNLEQQQEQMPPKQSPDEIQNLEETEQKSE
jgi:hypothetical protein